MGLYTVHFPLSPVLAASPKVWYFSGVLQLLSSFLSFALWFLLSYWLLRNVLLNFHMVVNFSNVLSLLISNVIPLCLEDTLVWFPFF